MAAPTPGGAPGAPGAPPAGASSSAAPLAVAKAAAAALAAAPQAAAAAQRESMPPQEWEAFWSAVETCMILQGGGTPSLASLQMSSAKASAGRAGRTNRCGTCAGCVRGDCGACKNCKDKPKFGGKGIKKQACVRRACNNPLPDLPEDCRDCASEDESEPLAKTARVLATAAGPNGFLSAATSPTHSAKATSFANPPAFELGGEAKAVGKAKATGDMLQDTRRRLQQLREASGADERPSSSMSVYSTADEYEAEGEEDANDANEGSEQQSGTEDGEDLPEHNSGEELLLALGRGQAIHA